MMRDTKKWQNTPVFTHISAYLHTSVSVTHHKGGQSEQTRTKQVIEFFTRMHLVFTSFSPEKHFGPLVRSYIA